MPVIVREENVNFEEFNQMYSKGMTKVLKEKIFKGGLTSEARPIAWKRILGLIDDQHLNTGKHNVYIIHMNEPHFRFERRLYETTFTVAKSDARTGKTVQYTQVRIL